MDDLNEAKRRVMKSMKRQNKNEVPYATTSADEAALADFVDGLVYVNAELYDVVTGLTTDAMNRVQFTAKFGPILYRIQQLGKQASGLDFSHFSVYETNEIKQLRDYIATNNDNFEQAIQGKQGSELTLNALQQLTNQVKSLLRFIDMKLQQPYSLNPLRGSGYLLPRHML